MPDTPDPHRAALQKIAAMQPVSMFDSPDSTTDAAFSALNECIDIAHQALASTDARPQASQAVSLQRIAQALEAIEKHLTPVITGTPVPDPDRPLRVGDYVVDITSSDKNRGRIATMPTANTVTIHWDAIPEPGEIYWPLSDFRRVQE